MFPVSNNGELRWVKSSRSAGNGECVEVAAVRGGIAMRDSKDPQGPILQFPAVTWQGFVDSVRAGVFDRSA
jgi:hypothetical protein